MPAPLQFGFTRASRLTMKKFRVGDGDAGVTATIKLMQGQVFGKEGVGSGEVRRAALEAVRGVARGMSEIFAVFQWVKDNIEFRGEYAETLQSPLVTLQLGAGDCDDHSMLLAALYECLGMETRFNTVSTGGEHDEFSHVFCEVRERLTKQWIPVDTTVRQSYPGWSSREIRRSQIRQARPPADRNIGLLAGILAAGALYLYTKKKG